MAIGALAIGLANPVAVVIVDVGDCFRRCFFFYKPVIGIKGVSGEFSVNRLGQSVPYCIVGILLNLRWRRVIGYLH